MFKAKKSISQNFLTNSDIKLKIKNRLYPLISDYPEHIILEIGPGKGDLSEVFLEFKRPLQAIEIDSRSVTFLQEKFADNKDFQIIYEDAYQMISKDNIDQKKFILLSNLPFHIGSRIMVELAIHYPKNPFAVILQKEVTQKLNNSKDFTFFGAWINLFWKTTKAFDISRNCFEPKPKVDTTMVIGKPIFVDQIPDYLKSWQERKKAQQVLKKLFANPRKTLANNLKNLQLNPQQIRDFFAGNQLDSKTRLTKSNYQYILTKILQNYV